MSSATAARSREAPSTASWPPPGVIGNRPWPQRRLFRYERKGPSLVLLECRGVRLALSRPSHDGFGPFLFEVMVAFYLARLVNARLFFVRDDAAPNPAIYDLEAEGVLSIRSRGMAAVLLRALWRVIDAATTARVSIQLYAGMPRRWAASARLGIRRTLYEAVRRASDRLKQSPKGSRRQTLAEPFKRWRTTLKPPKPASIDRAYYPTSPWPPTVVAAARRVRHKRERHIDFWDLDYRLLFGRAPIRVTLRSDLDAAATLDLERLGLSRDARCVLLHIREGGYGASRGVHERVKDVVRNVPVETYFPAIDRLVERGYTVVRIGDPTMTPITRPGVVDLATSAARTSLLEVACAARSTFMILGDSGPLYLSWLLARPALSANMVGNPSNSYPLRERDRYVLKPVRDHRKGRYLSALELVSEEYLVNRFDLERFGAEPNSADELLAAVDEMLATVAGGDAPWTAAQRAFKTALDELAARDIGGKNKVQGKPRFVGDGRIAAGYADKWLHGEPAAAAAPSMSAGPPVDSKEQAKLQRKALRIEATRERRQALRELSELLTAPVLRDAFAALPLTLVDVGARGGVPEHWEQAASVLRVIAFDADPAVTGEFDQQRQPDVLFVPKALHHSIGRRPFHISAHLAESSFLKPNPARLSAYGVPNAMETTRTIEVETTTLDAVADDYGVRWMDAVKLDTEGTELAILQSATRSLAERVFALEIEVEFVDIYEGQPLFADVDQFVRGYGFELFDLLDLENRRMARRGVSRFAELTLPKSRGQLTGGDALYFHSTATVEQRLATLPVNERLRYLCGAVAVCLVHGHVDYAEQLLNVAHGSIEPCSLEALHTVIVGWHPARRRLRLDS